MTIQQKDCLIHWNYFLALEHDLVECSSYVEFSKENSNAYSIKFAQLLFASSSEVDVIAKEICKIIRPNEEIEGINNYRPVILGRYGLDFKPWSVGNLIKVLSGGKVIIKSNMKEMNISYGQT